MKKILSTILIWMATGGIALADTVNASIGAPAVTDHSDLSIAYLGQIFGTVGNVLHGTSGQMLGHLFYKFNQGILIVLGMFLVYTVVTVVLKSIQQGSFMGANKNVAITLLKLAIGVGLILPNPATGYSVFQDIVMKVAVEGVALADMTWDYSLDYIGVGGTLWHRPEKETGSSGFNFIKSLTNKNNNLTGPTNTLRSPSTDRLGAMQKVFYNEVLMVQASYLTATNDQDQNNNSFFNGSAPKTMYHITPNEATQSFDFGKDAPYGSISWNIQNFCQAGSGQSEPGKMNKCALARQATRTLVDALLPAAKTFVCQYGTNSSNANCMGIDVKDADQNIKNTFFNALANYLSLVRPLMIPDHKSSDKSRGFIKQAEADGWITAGRYYWDLSQVEAAYDVAGNPTNYVGRVTVTVVRPLANSLPLSAIQNSGSYTSSAVNQLSSYMNASGKGNTGGADYKTSVGSNIVLRILLTPIVGDVVGLFNDFSTDGSGMGPDPIYFLHKVGMHCMAISGDIWLSLTVALFGIGVASMFMQMCVNFASAVEMGAHWLEPPLMVLAAALLGIGVILAYYVPLYPFMLFTFGVVGWFISVIEAMAAAPLVCLGLTHPEGHDFLGSAGQALTLLLSVFIRPVLMVMGLIAGMITSYVSLRLLVYTYSGFLMDLFHVGRSSNTSGSILQGAAMQVDLAMLQQFGSMGGMILSLFVFPLMLAIFAMIVFIIVDQCFSLIHVLPDSVLRWIGAPNTSVGGNPGQLAKQVKGMISSGAQSFGSGMNNTITAQSRKNAGTPAPQGNDVQGGADNG